MSSLITGVRSRRAAGAPAVAAIAAVLFAMTLLVSCRPPAEQWKAMQTKAEQLRKQGDTAAAIKEYKAAVKQMDETQAAPKQEIVCLNQLIVLLLQERKAAEAKDYAEKALSMAERQYGPDHINVMPQVVLVQRVAADQGDKQTVTKTLDRIIEIQQKRTGPESQPVMWLLDQYARTRSLSCGDGFDEAKLRQLVHLREKFVGLDNLETTRDRIILAAALSQKGESKESLEIYASCMELARKKYPGLLPELCINYAKALRKNKQNDRALPLLKEAYTLAGPGPKYNSVLAPEIATELGWQLEELKQKKEAAAVYKTMADQLDADKNKKSEYFKGRLAELQG